MTCKGFAQLLASVLGFASSASASVSVEVVDALSAQCQFEEHPVSSYMWDPSCNGSDVELAGCLADGISEECRWCGKAPYPPCPTCEFDIQPKTQVIWDNKCSLHGYSMGCLADGVHFECRFCGEEPWDSCDANAWNSPVEETQPIYASLCTFSDPPRAPFAWDPRCQDPLADIPGCNADGVHRECRYCGEAPFEPCPTCEFFLEPTHPVVWDNRCVPAEYTKGCLADGIHFECRHCGADGLDPCPSTTTSTSTRPDLDIKSTASPGELALAGSLQTLSSAAAPRSAALLGLWASVAVASAASVWSPGGTRSAA